MPNKKIVVFALISFIILPVFGQANTYSPYSRFGLGELTLPGYTQNRSMGLTGIALRSNKQINYRNPASYTAIDTMSFIFDFGLFGSKTNYEAKNLNSSLTNMNLDHLSIGFAITKWWSASAGVMPYSSTGYNIIDQQNNSDIGLIDYSFKGDGGLNQFYLGTAFSLFNKISLGINMSNIFGYIQHTQGVNFPSDAYSAESSVDNKMVISGIVFNFGAQYHEIIHNKYFINAGVIYDNETRLNADQTLIHRNTFPGQGVALNDSTVLYPEFEISSTDTRGKIIYPQNMGAGIAFGIKDRLTISGDYSSQKWSKSRIMGKADSLVNSKNYNFGMEVTPNPNALRGYFNRVHYRLGGYYSNTYLRIRGEAINDYGITFGVGLPFKGTKTTFNLGMVLGQRGTLENNLIKENYGIINVSFTLHDFWFFKRKFD